MGVTLPYTITNGTPHDAVPVQGNFEALRDGHNTHAHDGVDTPKVNFANIDGKPVAYPPSGHTHPGTDVTSAVAEATHAANADSATNASNATNADTVDGAHAGTAANNVLKLDSAGKVPVGNLPIQYGTVTINTSAAPGRYDATAALVPAVPLVYLATLRGHPQDSAISAPWMQVLNISGSLYLYVHIWQSDSTARTILVNWMAIG